MVSRGGRQALTASDPLHVRLMRDLKQRLERAEWRAGEHLPTEHELADEYAVSRSTVRTALKLLESQGMVRTRHGAGSFVTPFGAQARAGLQELRSTTETLRAQGFEPSVSCRLVERRPCSSEFAASFSLPAETPVVYMEREIRADGLPVVFAYEEILAELIDIPLEPHRFSRSIFELLESRGVTQAYASTDISAVHDESVGWGQRPAGALYLLLKQAHFTRDGAPTVFARSYFVEGKFRFSIMRMA